MQGLIASLTILILSLNITVYASESDGNAEFAIKEFTSYEIILVAKYVIQNGEGRYYICDILRGHVDAQLNDIIKKSIEIEKFTEDGKVLFLFKKVGLSYLPMKTPIRKNGKLLFLADGKAYWTDMDSLTQEIIRQDRKRNPNLPQIDNLNAPGGGE